MRSILNRALMILRSLSADTRIWSFCVIAGAIFLSVGFFIEPNNDYSNTSRRVVKVEMQKAASSNLTIDLEVVKLSKDCESLNSPSEDVIVDSAEYDQLCRLVEGEAGIEDEIGKKMVTEVVINRVNSGAFPNDIVSVIYEPGQFALLERGNLDNISPDHVTREVVIEVLKNKSTTTDALYFQRSKAKIWGDKKYLFRYGSHSFYGL